MSNFLNSVKADLTDRRMLPILVIVGVALAGALAYAVLAGGGSSTTTAALSPTPTVTKVSGVVVTQSHVSTDKPVAETTSGDTHRSSNPPRDPFKPLPTPSVKTASTPASTSAAPSAGSGSSTSGSSGSATTESAPSSQGTGGGTSSPPSKAPAPAKPKKLYNVAVLFGTAPAGTPPLQAQLTPYEDLKRQQPLPDAKQPLVVFRGVIAGGKSATFTLVGEAILRGSAACLPSASQCVAIDLKAGQTEELEYIPLGSAAVVYQLQVVSINPVKASASAARRALRGESRSGLAVLRNAGLASLPGLRYSDSGVLVFAGRKAFASRSHASMRRAHPKP
jgi:hypothetical protein